MRILESIVSAFKRLAEKSRHLQRPRTVRLRTLQFERLEDRRVLTTVAWNGMDLSVTGTGDSDAITITSVFVDGTDYALVEHDTGMWHGKNDAPVDNPATAAAVNTVHLNGLEGNDVLDVREVRAEFGYTGIASITIRGAAGRDTIRGSTEYGNTVYGDEGDDNIVLFGSMNADTVYGGAGRDFIRTGDGNDIVWGQQGRDDIDGGPGDDLLDGGDPFEYDADTVSGGDGNDRIYGGGGPDSLSGGPGNDTISGNGGNDKMYGDSGEDELFGGEGNDELHGDEGNDNLAGGNGIDELFGEDGDDILEFGPTGTSSAETADGGIGNDTLIGSGDAFGNFIGGEGDDTIKALGYLGATGNSIFGGSGDDFIDASEARDTIYGGFGNDDIYGNGGRDTIYGNSGADYILGGAGNDFVYGGSNSAISDYDDDDDSLYGGDGKDLIVGEDGDDFISGGAGKDTILGGKGNDTLVGGDDKDRIEGGTENDDIDGGAGEDLLFSNVEGTPDQPYNGTGPNPGNFDMFGTGPHDDGACDYEDGNPDPECGGAAASVSIDDVWVYEDGASAMFTLSLSNSVANDVVVEYHTVEIPSSSNAASAETDYTPVEGTATIIAGSTTASIAVPIIDDYLEEVDESFQLNLIGATYASIGDSQGIGTIYDNDYSPVAEDDGTFYVGYESSLQGNVLANDYDPDGAPNPLSAQLVSSTANGSLTLNSDGSFSYTPNAEYWGVDSFTYKASDGVNLSNTASVSIYVNAPVFIYIDDSSVYEDGDYMIFDVWLSEASQDVVQVDYATLDGSAEAGSDYAAASGTVEFQPGETSAMVSVSITDDSLDEDDEETFAVTLSNAVNATISDDYGDAEGTIYDDDDPPTVSIAGTSVSESAGVAQFEVTLSEASGKDVTVYYYSSDGSGSYPATTGIDYAEIQSDSLVIEAGETSATIDMSIHDDSLDEYDETFVVTLSSADNAGLGDSDGVGTIIDDDPPPVISIADASGLESGGSILFDVELSAVSGKDVTAYYYTSASSGSYPATAATDYSEVQDGWLFIAAGQTGTTAEVYINDDYIDEYNETFDGTLTSADNATIDPDDTAEGTIIDDDAPPEITMDVDDDGYSGPAELFDDSSSVDFGTTDEGTSVTRTFTVENEGTGDLTLDFASANVPAGFSLSGQSGTVTVAAGSSITFNVELDATSPGYFSGNLSLSNNDSDENPFDVYLEGNVNALEPEIEMDVDDDGYSGPAELFDNSSSVDFGTTDEGTPVTRTFTVENEGDADLTLDFASASVPAGFSLSGQSGTVTVAPGNSITFNIALDASSPGYYSGNLTLANNDSDEDPFDVYLYGEVSALQPEIEMDVDDDGYSGPAELFDNSSSVDFGTTDEGTPVTRTFTVENDGTGDLTLDFPTASVPAGFSLSGQSGTVTVAPGSSITFNVELDATNPGYFSGSLSLSNNDSDEDPFDVYLEGNVNALEPEIEMDVDDDGYSGPAELFDDSSSVDFGTTDEGTSVTRTFTVENEGDADLTLDFASASVPAGFSLSGQSGTVTVAAGNSITFNVELDATGPGYFSGNLSLSNNDSDESPFDVYLEGNVNALAPEIEMHVDDDGYSGPAELFDDSSSVDFGTTDEGTSVTRTFTVENEGTGDLTLDFTSASVPAGFSLSGQSGTVTVAPGSSITFNVELDATSAGYFSGNLSLSNNDSDENPFDVYLYGEVSALQPEIEMDVDDDGYSGPAELFDDSSSVDFGTTDEGTPVTRTFTVENEGTGDLTLDFASANVPAGFSLSGQSGTVTVAAGSSITFNVELDATGPGYFSGSLSLSNNDSDENPFDVYLEGNVNALEPEIEMDVDDDGYSGPAELFDDSSGVDFGTTDEGTSVTRTFTVENEGTGDLTLDFASASVPAGFSLSGQSGTVTVAPGSSITFNVELDATSAGYFSGNLSLSNNDSDENPFDVHLEGNVNALEPEIEMDVDDDGYSGPAELFDDSSGVDFGTTDEGTSVTRTFTVENEGTGDLTLDFASASVPSGFSLSGQSGTVTVAPGSSITFNVALDASSPGYFSGNLTLSNNDSNEDPFDVFLYGEVNTLQPEIALEHEFDDGNGGYSYYELYDGDSVYFDSTVTGAPITETFVVHNTGTDDLVLNLGGTILPAGFSFAASPATTLAAGESTSIAVQLDAATAGTFSGNLELANNDSDENPFDVYLYGYVDTPEYLTLDMAAVSNSSVPELTASQVTPLANEAARRWLLAGADAGELRSMLATVDIRISDLPGPRLGAAGDNDVLLDVDAAGYGWFIDTSPRDDRDFQKVIGHGEWQATAGSDAAGRADLLTVIAHEFGHLLGLEDLPAAELPHHIMTDTIGLGTRRAADSLPQRQAAEVHNDPAVYDLFQVDRAPGRPLSVQRPVDNSRQAEVRHASPVPAAAEAETDDFLRTLDTVLAAGEEEASSDHALDAIFGDERKLDEVLGQPSLAIW